VAEQAVPAISSGGRATVGRAIGSAVGQWQETDTNETDMTIESIGAQIEIGREVVISCTISLDVTIKQAN
jgi:hypothetical protein